MQAHTKKSVGNVLHGSAFVAPFQTAVSKAAQAIRKIMPVSSFDATSGFLTCIKDSWRKRPSRKLYLKTNSHDIASNAAVQAIIALIPVSSHDAASASVDMQDVLILVVRMENSVHYTGYCRAALESST